jgi:hypothetical protein
MCCVLPQCDFMPNNGDITCGFTLDDVFTSKQATNAFVKVCRTLYIYT